MIKSTLLVLLAALIVLLAYAATRPGQFRVERSVRIAAPPERLHGLINDLHRMNTWNPYAKKDPAMKGSYSGPASGPGATFDFEGKQSGSGRMAITATEPAKQVTMSLVMTAPFPVANTIDFGLQPEAGATKVTWAMHGPSPYLAKLMGIFFDMDKMVGTDFERGLADLKVLAETR